MQIKSKHTEARVDMWRKADKEFTPITSIVVALVGVAVAYVIIMSLMIIGILLGGN